MNRAQKGFTIIELMVVVVVVAILLAIAVPAMQGYYEKRRLTGAAEQIHDRIVYARTEAIKRSATIYVGFNVTSGTPTSWYFGLSDVGGCDGDATKCVMKFDTDGDGNVDNDVSMKIDSTAYPGISMYGASGAAEPTFTGSLHETQFDPVRGTTDYPGTIVLKSTNYELDVKLNRLGRVTICSPAGTSNLGGYPEC